MSRDIGTHEIGIYFVEELFDAQDSLEDEVIFASPAMQLEQVLFIIPGSLVETYELDSAPYVQSWSAVEQVVHGVPPSHLTTQVSEERGNRKQETRGSTEEQPTDRILRPRQVSHCGELERRWQGMKLIDLPHAMCGAVSSTARLRAGGSCRPWPAAVVGQLHITTNVKELRERRTETDRGNEGSPAL